METKDKIRNTLTKKQFEVFKKWMNENPKTTLLSGGVRAGKTFLLGLLFLLSIRKLKDKEGLIVIAGFSKETIRNNVIDVLEKWTGKKINLYNTSDGFMLFGEEIRCIGVGNAGSEGRVRGFTAKIVLINEVSKLHAETIKDLRQRCSVDGGIVLMDTNPTNRYSYVYKKIISLGNKYNEDGQMLQLVEHFTMLDNADNLDKMYLESTLLNYPKGSIEYKRDVLGQYADAEGLIYYMFNEEKYVINEMPRGVGVVRYICGQDFGFGSSHAGSLLVIAKLTDGRFVIVDGKIEEGQLIDYWQDLLTKYNKSYGVSAVYADHARPDLIQEMRKTNISIMNADKSVDLGINFVKSLLLENKLLFLKGSCPEKLFEEFGAYAWDSKTDKPIKNYDNGMDGMRYGLYTENKLVDVPKTMYSGYRGPLIGKQFRY